MRELTEELVLGLMGTHLSAEEREPMIFGVEGRERVRPNTMGFAAALVEAVTPERVGGLTAETSSWQPIETADRALTSRIDFPGIPASQHSYPIWCRFEGGEPFEASWVRTDAGKEYWWAWDLEDVADPDEWMPHPFDRAHSAVGAHP
jgi:hypothetical protein